MHIFAVCRNSHFFISFFPFQEFYGNRYNIYFIGISISWHHRFDTFNRTSIEKALIGFAWLWLLFGLLFRQIKIWVWGIMIYISHPTLFTVCSHSTCFILFPFSVFNDESTDFFPLQVDWNVDPKINLNFVFCAYQFKPNV